MPFFGIAAAFAFTASSSSNEHTPGWPHSIVNVSYQLFVCVPSSRIVHCADTPFGSLARSSTGTSIDGRSTYQHSSARSGLLYNTASDIVSHSSCALARRSSKRLRDGSSGTPTPPSAVTFVSRHVHVAPLHSGPTNVPRVIFAGGGPISI